MSANDRGETLVETLLSIVILGIAVVAIVGALATFVSGTDVHRKQSDTFVVLENAAEVVKADSNTFVRCAVPSDYTSAVAGTTRPTGWSAPVVTSITYWNGSTFGSTCYDNTVAPNIAPLQLITLEAKSPDGRGDFSLSVVKRRSS